MHGVLNILKPPGMTSHDVVALMRRICRTRRIGHTGTLDPGAAGVLVVCAGHATRLVEDLQAGTKTYRAELTFGYETDSCDATGTIIAQGDAGALTSEDVEAILPDFQGEINQIPPLRSAVKVEGQRLYELAHAGVTEADIPSRRVTIYSLHLTRFQSGETSEPPRALLDIECGGGTYIRSLVRDIGRALGCRATMTFLARTRSGPFTSTAACTLEEVAANPLKYLLPLPDMLRHCARDEVVDDAATRKLAYGQMVQMEQTTVLSAAESSGYTLFWNPERTTAVLARSTTPDSSGTPQYRPDKVFFLNRLDD